MEPIPPAKFDVSSKHVHTLIEITKEQGYCFFVKYATLNPSSRQAEIQRRHEATEWLNQHQIDFSWVGGRSTYEFAFRTREEAVLFKIAWGV